MKHEAVNFDADGASCRVAPLAMSHGRPRGDGDADACACRDANCPAAGSRWTREPFMRTPLLACLRPLTATGPNAEDASAIPCAPAGCRTD